MYHWIIDKQYELVKSDLFILQSSVMKLMYCCDCDGIEYSFLLIILLFVYGKWIMKILSDWNQRNDMIYFFIFIFIFIFFFFEIDLNEKNLNEWNGDNIIFKFFLFLSFNASKYINVINNIYLFTKKMILPKAIYYTL